MNSTADAKPPTAAAERFCLAAALLIAGYYLATSIYISYHRLFWYDEVFTTLSTRLPDLHTIWQALVEDKSDRTPFGYFVIARFFDKLLGPSEIGIRLPSALAMTAGMLLTYDCVRRAADGLHGLIAMAVLPCTFLPYYGYEGRCYALYFMFATAVLWAWAGRRSPLLLAALFFVGVTMHFYLILCLVPFALEEAWHWRPWRWPSPWLLSSGMGSAIALALLFPQIHSSGGGGVKWWTDIGIRQIPLILEDLFPSALFLLALVTLWVTWNDRGEAFHVKSISRTERTGWFFLLIPIAGWVLAQLVTHAYLHRYLIGTLPGVAVGFACLMWRRFRHIQRIGVGALVVFLGYGMANQAVSTWHVKTIKAWGLAQERTRAILAVEDELSSKGKRYVVFDDTDIRFLEVRYYSKHPERYVSWSFVNPMPPPSRYYPMQRWSLSDIKQHAGETVLLDLAPDKLEMLQQAGYRTTLHTYGGIVVVFLE